jgi:hypothetical protein
MASRGFGTWLGAVAGGVGLGLGMVALVQLPGSLLAFALGFRGSLEATLALPTTLGAMLMLVFARLVSGVAYTRQRLIVGVLVAVATVLGTEQFVIPQPSQETGLERTGDLFVYPAGRLQRCEAGQCDSRSINALGLRGPLPSTPNARRIVVLGDSHVYGFGVRDDETLPRALQRDIDPAAARVDVVNGGIEGLSLETFPQVARHAATIQPDLLVALVKDDDVDETDRNTRLLRARDSFGTRFVTALNLELPRDVLWRFAVLRLGLGDTRGLLVRQLDALYDARSGARLMLLTRLHSGLEPALNRWLETHHDVFHEVIDGEAWQQAPKLPDGHPDAEGYRIISASIAKPVLRALELTDRRIRTAP